MMDYLKLIDTKTIKPRYDVTPLFKDFAVFSQVIDDLVADLEDTTFDIVVGIDALGFILGTAIAWRCQKGFIPIRKEGKLPAKTDSAACIDYTGQKKILEIRYDALQPGQQVLIVDEWIETGSQMRAAISLVERQGGIVAGIAAIHIDLNDATRSLVQTYRCFSLQQE